MVGPNPIAEEEPEPAASNPDATIVGHNPMEERAPRKRTRSKLVVVEGKEEGRVIELEDGTTVVGRSKDADVCLLDIQISRHHIEVVSDEDGVFVRDLESGNGTLVNDEPIEEIDLADGDEIAIGDHVLRFEQARPAGRNLPARSSSRSPSPPSRSGSAPPPPAVDIVRQARRKRTQRGNQGGGKKKIFAFSLVAILAGVAVVFVALQPDEPPPEPTGPSDQEIAQQSFSVGMRHFREASYEDALQHFETAVEHMPNHGQANRYLSAAQREIDAKETMDRGNDLLEEGDYDGARQAFGQVGDDSLRHDDAQQALRRVDDEQAGGLVREADELLEQNRLDDAKAGYEAALAVVSDFEAARDGLDRVEERRRQISRMSQRERERLLAEQKRKEREEQEQAKREVREALAAGENRFNQGDFHGAMATFSELRQSSNQDIAGPAGRKADALRRFTPAYERGMSALESRNAEQAVNDLEVAEQQAQVIAPNGRMHRQVKSNLAEMHNLQARVAHNANRYQVAYRHWSQALKADSTHSASRQGMNQLIEKAEELRLQAYTSRSLNRSESIRMLRQVLSMTPPSSETHERAKSLLDDLER